MVAASAGRNATLRSEYDGYNQIPADCFNVLLNVDPRLFTFRACVSTGAVRHEERLKYRSTAFQ